MINKIDIFMNNHLDLFQKRYSLIFIIILLIVLGLAAYWPVRNYEFVRYDDPVYVSSNEMIQSGITFKSIADTFTDIHTGHWHPLTMLSHMLDWQLFRGNAGGHHWTNVILHIFNTVLLFLLLKIMTGFLWRSAMVAALFAVHPINVESVAWIAERKNVLSTFFWIMTMLCYVWYVRAPNWKRYLPVLICFVLGLMSKPMLVTLPFVLLLMDYWPLNRTTINFKGEETNATTATVSTGKFKIPFLIAEKTPLLILSVISMGLTLYAAQQGKTIAAIQTLSLAKRVSNVVFSYVLYIKKLFWPTDLAVIYPFPDIVMWQATGAALLLIVVTALVCRYFRKYAYLPVGWFWYLGTLVPVIGLIQVGRQSMADRYAYIPFIGLFIMIVWGVANALKTRISATVALLTSGGILAALLLLTGFQVQHWKNTITLFEHALQVTQGNYTAEICLANELLEKGRVNQAIPHYYSAWRLYSKGDEALAGLGLAFSMQGKNIEALASFQKALSYNPDSERALLNIGFVYFRLGRVEDAIREYNRAIALYGNNPELYNNLGIALGKQGNVAGAVFQFRKALQIQPEHAGAHNNLAMILAGQGNTAEALKHFQEAVRLQPAYANAHFYLARLLRKEGRWAEADDHYQKAIQINPEYSRQQ